MFIEPTITWVPSGFSGYIWLDTKNVLKKKKDEFRVSGGSEFQNRGPMMKNARLPRDVQT